MKLYKIVVIRNGGEETEFGPMAIHPEVEEVFNDMELGASVLGYAVNRNGDMLTADGSNGNFIVKIVPAGETADGELD